MGKARSTAANQTSPPAARPGVTSRSVTPHELLGTLTELEQKYAPPRLFISGPMEIPLPRPRVAIAGTRQPSDAGLNLARELASSLASHGAIIVSGLARGIDTTAHKAAIDAGGKTIAVLGTPLSRTYPAENASLQRLIAEKHLAISQFPEDCPVQPKNFVLRNRTMALIADASVIVESGDSGGSLHQGWEALRLGRPLFIHSREFSKPSVQWPGRMAEYGAMKFEEPSDILEFLPSEYVAVAVAALLNA
jgi:DNA processing protein